MSNEETIISDTDEERENEEIYDDGKPDRFSESELAEREQEYNDLDVDQLREELLARGLSTDGEKKELVSRLVRDDFDHEEMDDERSHQVVEEEIVEEVEEEVEEEFVEWNKDGEHETVEADGNDVDRANAHVPIESHDDDKKPEEVETTQKEVVLEEGDLKGEDEEDVVVDVSKDRDLFYLKWEGKKIVVPFKCEVIKDLLVFHKHQSVIVYPLEVADIYLDIFRKYMTSAITFTIEMDESKPGTSLKGFLRLKFRTLKDASAAIDDLKSAKEGLTVKHFSKDDIEGSSSSIMSKILGEDSNRHGPTLCRLVYVGNLPNSVTETTLTEHFADALQVIIPRDEETQERLGYAYLEYANEEDAYEAAEKYKEVELDGEKLYIIKAIAEKKEKYGLLRDSLRLYWVDQIKRLRKILDHSRDKPSWEVEEAEQKLHLLKRRLDKDRRRREVLRLTLPDGPDDKAKTDDEDNKDKRERSKSSRSRSTSRTAQKSSSYQRPLRRSPDSRDFRRESYRPSRGGRTYAPREDVANKLVDQLQGLVSVLTDKLPGGDSRGPPRRGYQPDSRYRGTSSRPGFTRSGYPRSGGYSRPGYSRSSDYYEEHRQTGYNQSNYPSQSYDRGSSYRGGGSYRGTGGDRYGPVKRSRDDEGFGPERKRRYGEYQEQSQAGRYPSSRPTYGGDQKYSTDRRHPPPQGQYSRPRSSRGSYSSAY